MRVIVCLYPSSQQRCEQARMVSDRFILALPFFVAGLFARSSSCDSDVDAEIMILHSSLDPRISMAYVVQNIRANLAASISP